MDASDDRSELEKQADAVLELTNMVAALRARSKPTGSDDLSETEFVALDLLTRKKSVTVGDIQKHVGVLPAQMSRVIRSLEKKSGKAFVQCSINPADRRKVDVQITPAGTAAHNRYCTARRKTSLEFLEMLSKDERTIFMKMIDAYRARIRNQLPK